MPNNCGDLHEWSAYICVLNHQMPFKAGRTHISVNFYPSVSYLRFHSCKSMSRSCWVSEWRTLTAHDLCWRKQLHLWTMSCSTACIYQMQVNLKHDLLSYNLLNCHSPLAYNSSNRDRAAPSLWGGMSKLDTPDDLHCTPALPWHLWFWFANMGKLEHFRWNLSPTRTEKLCNLFSPGTIVCPFLLRQHQERHEIVLFAFHRNKYWRLSKREGLYFLLPSLTDWIVNQLEPMDKN